MSCKFSKKNTYKKYQGDLFDVFAAFKVTMEESRKKAERLVDVNTIEHTDAREIGANGKACGGGQG